MDQQGITVQRILGDVPLWRVCGNGVCAQHPQRWQAQVMHHCLVQASEVRKRGNDQLQLRPWAGVFRDHHGQNLGAWEGV